MADYRAREDPRLARDGTPRGPRVDNSKRLASRSPPGRQTAKRAASSNAMNGQTSRLGTPSSKPSDPRLAVRNGNVNNNVPDGRRASVPSDVTSPDASNSMRSSRRTSPDSPTNRPEHGRSHADNKNALSSRLSAVSPSRTGGRAAESVSVMSQDEPISLVDEEIETALMHALRATTKVAAMTVARDQTDAVLKRTTFEWERNRGHFATYQSIADNKAAKKAREEGNLATVQSALDLELVAQDGAVKSLAVNLASIIERQAQAQMALAQQDLVPRQEFDLLQAQLDEMRQKLENQCAENNKYDRAQRLLIDDVKQLEGDSRRLAQLPQDLMHLRKELGDLKATAQLQDTKNLEQAVNHIKDHQKLMATRFNDMVEGERHKLSDNFKKMERQVSGAMAKTVAENINTSLARFIGRQEMLEEVAKEVEGATAGVREEFRKLKIGVEQSGVRELEAKVNTLDAAVRAGGAPATAAATPTEARPAEFVPILPAAPGEDQAPRIDFTIHPAVRDLNERVASMQVALTGLGRRYDGLLTDALAQQMLDQLAKLYPEPKAIMAQLRQQQSMVAGWDARLRALEQGSKEQTQTLQQLKAVGDQNSELQRGAIEKVSANLLETQTILETQRGEIDVLMLNIVAAEPSSR